MLLSIRRKRLLLLLLALGLSFCCSRGKEEPYLARVKDRKLVLSEVYGGEGEKPSPSSLYDFVSLWINDELLYNEAKAMRLENEPDIKRQISESIRQILINAYIQRVVDSRIKITDKEIEDYYAAHSAEFVRTQDEIFLKHIFVRDQAKADDIKNRLSSGEDFSAVAREYSEDGYGYSGGQVGYVSFDDLPQEIRVVAQKAKTGVFYGPIKTNYGYHFVLVEDFRAKGTPKEIREVRDEISSIIYSGKYDSLYKYLVDSLKQVYKVEINNVLIDSLAGKPK